MTLESCTPTDTWEASSMGLPGSEKPGPNLRGGPVARRNPTVLRMVLAALQAGEQRQGTSVVAIKQYILQKYPTVSAVRLSYLLKQALAKGINRGLLVRPLNSRARGATGSFKLVSKKKRTTQSRKTSTNMAPRNPSQVQKEPKNPSKTKNDPPNPGEVKKLPQALDKVKKVPNKPDTKEKASKKGSEAKAKVAKQGEAKKVPLKPEKAVQAPRSAAGCSRKLSVKGGSSSEAPIPAEAEVPRKTHLGSKSSKAKTAKSKNGTAFPSTKNPASGPTIPQKAAAGAGKEPELKAAASPKASSRSKAGPRHLGRKTEAPRSLRRPELSAKAS